MLDLQSINAGFSRKADVYDAYCAAHPVIRWARGFVRRQVEAYLPAGGSILELNAGTGADAAYFVRLGYQVHATDLADGMMAAIRAKAQASGQAARFTAQQLSFTRLDETVGGPYDLVFSNFGGLNCVPHIEQVAEGLPAVLKPGGYLVWVIMPPICPWELVQALRGRWRTAVRRLAPGGADSHVEGAYFKTYYFSPGQVCRALGAAYRLIAQRSICLVCPPSFMENFPRRYPALTSGLMWADEALGNRWPWNQFGDFVMLTLQYLPHVA